MKGVQQSYYESPMKYGYYLKISAEFINSITFIKNQIFTHYGMTIHIYRRLYTFPHFLTFLIKRFISDKSKS